MIRGIISLYSPRYLQTLIYMLQSEEYKVGPYLKWYWHTANFSKVAHRGALDRTKAARLLLLVLRIGVTLQLLLGVLMLGLWKWHGTGGAWEFGLAIILLYPVVWAHFLVIPLVLGRLFIVGPRERRAIKASENIFRKHPGVKIAIAGSYGKTSMKELLLTVLGEGKKVAATPANKNVAISHAQFAKGLHGNEDVLLIEYGEGAPGDVERFARITHPTHAIITGIAPAHLDRYKTVDRAAKDIFSVTKFVDPAKVYVNKEPKLTSKYSKDKFNAYDATGALGWKVSDIEVNLGGTRFKITKDKDIISLHSGLLGRHQIGPLAFVAALAAELGLNKVQIQHGITKTMPYEHRMQPYPLHGAWIIDDTYNGNLEGIRAGTVLLKELPAERKIYVTPGLVDQGAEMATIHQEIGRLIAEAKPDIVVLMRNSVSDFIQKGLAKAKFSGEVLVENDPLDFYNNLQVFVASGDLVLMQNDWPDKYK